MSIFEFLMVLVSLIIGLGVAELLTGIARTIRNRATVETYWVHSMLAAIVFIALLQQWWEIWGLRDTSTWSFPGLVFMLGGPIGLFLIAHLLFPEDVRDTDLRTYYYNEMQPILLLAVATVLAAALFRPIVIGTPLFELDNVSSAVLIIVFVAMRAISRPWFHGAMVILIFAAVCLDILVWSREIS